MAGEKIEVKKNKGEKRPDGLMSMTMGLFGGIPYKHLITLFVLFMFISNDVFINRVLSKVNKNFVAYPGQTSTLGTVVQGIILVLLFAVGSFLIDRNVI